MKQGKQRTDQTLLKDLAVSLDYHYEQESSHTAE